MSYRTEVGLLLFLALVLTAALVAGRRRSARTPAYEPASTYHKGPMGGQAPYDVLARLGIAEERRRTALYELTTESRRRPAVLMVVSPELWLASAELESVARYLGTGGELVAVGQAGGLTECLGWTSAEPDSSGTRRSSRDSVAVVLPTGLTRLPAVTRVLRPIASDTTESHTKSSAVLGKTGRPERVLRELGDCREASRIGADTLLGTAGGAPVLVRLRFRGGGRALLVADDHYFRNAAWRYSDAPELLVPLLVPATRGRITWDEYHHGYGPGGSIASAVLSWTARSPVGWALWQLAVVALIWLAVTAVRFGPPRAVIDRRRRSPVEHLEALAAGLEGAAGVETAVALTISGLRRRLSRAGQPLRGDTGGWLSALELALPGVRGRAAARRLQELLTKPGGAERVLGAAQAVEDVWEELRPRAKPAGSSTR